MVQRKIRDFFQQYYVPDSFNESSDGILPGKSERCHIGKDCR